MSATPRPRSPQAESRQPGPVSLDVNTDSAVDASPGQLSPGQLSPGQLSRRHVIAGAAALGAGATIGTGLLAGCGGGAASGTRKQTLYLAGWQWGPAANFNPASPTAGFPTAARQMQLVYESLFMFDLRDSSLQPQLAASIQQTDARTLVVKLRPEAAWQDGKPVTADDVVYTFDLGKRQTGVYWNSAWEYLDAVTKTDDTTVTFALRAANPNPGMTRRDLCETYILPAHVWSQIEKQYPTVAEYPNTKPVGSGPYTLDSYNGSQLVYVRDDKYWGKSVHGQLPAPKRIVHPIYKDNASGDLAFEQGQVDVMQQFTPQIWKMWTDKHKPVGTWYDAAPYFIPAGMPMLVFNTARPGLNNAKVRRALAFSIDYPRIAEQAVSRYSEPVRSSLILPTEAEKQYFDEANIAANGWKYDPAKAKHILEAELGAKKGSDGVYTLPDGTRLAWKLQTPTGWSDWQTAIQVVAESTKACGFDLTLDYPQVNQLTPSVQTGNFDLVLWYIGAQTTAATPWQRFRDVMEIRGVNPVGQNAYFNYGRFSDPRVAPLLDRAATATGADLRSALTELDTIFMQNAPMVPLVYRPLDFFEYNESVWTGFPNAKEPTAPPTFSGAGVLWLYGISAK